MTDISEEGGESYPLRLWSDGGQSAFALIGDCRVLALFMLLRAALRRLNSAA